MADSKQPSIWRRLLMAFAIALLTVSLGLGAAAGYLAYRFFTEVPPFSVDDFAAPQTSFLLDVNGLLIAELHGPQHRIPVPLEQIPLRLRQAVLATEDVRFYDHPGVDLQGILRAVKANYNAGSIQEGGSTITQQLIKNVYLSPEKTLERKLKEVHLAYHLERQVGKDRVLELYLNRIYFGEGAYGVEAAARTYFGKTLKELTLSESALLAGLPKNPGAYSPTVSLEASQERRNTVINQMARHGLITPEQAQRARLEPIRLIPQPTTRDVHYPYPFFVDEVLREAVQVHGISEDRLFGGGLRIQTTLDPRVQQLAEDLFTNADFFPAGNDDRLIEGALASVDPLSGHVKALMGGRTYAARRGFNRATMMQRSPGSAIKPLGVYAPALEQGWTPDSLLPDEDMGFNGYRPANYDGAFRGRVTMRQAVAQSINVPAVWLLNQIGTRRSIETLRALGLPVSENDAHLSLALGGMERGVSPLDMARAYSALANNGVFVPSRTIIQIYDAQGNPLVKPAAQRVVFQPSTARAMTNLLQDAIRYGTGQEARLSRPVAGKTGTAELPPVHAFEGVKGNRDAWFVGYSPELVTAVWMGYDITDREHYMNRIYGGSYPARLFRAFMEGALEGAPPRESELFSPEPTALRNRTPEPTPDLAPESAPQPTPEPALEPTPQPSPELAPEQGQSAPGPNLDRNPVVESALPSPGSETKEPMPAQDDGTTGLKPAATDPN
ncbi:PBP1A family penicillin-binding protein [Heliobacterium undosum]|uniref:Penicillin-binding protein 1A n=1 Tax=Heliomicrobium undosum TaxID=121734 RepID=A0A845KZR3_9FIRM|nr:PBP1A family penicillin-binding protein [Heliomicrobium undosum]MZP28716.1 PBP1A family penicillin-binding protein [Heliomicrobium undosum]